MIRIVKPYLLSVKNRLKRRKKSFVVRDLLLIGFAFFIAYTLYFGVTYTLSLLNTYKLIGYVSAHQLLGMIFFPFLFLLLSSALALSFGAFFISEDNEILYAAPVTPRTFYLGKVLLVILGTLWMPIIFLVPIIIAFGMHYHATPLMMGWGMVSLIPMLLIPVCFATGASVFLLRFVPHTWYRYIGGLFGVLVLYLLYTLSEVISSKIGASSPAEVFRYIDKISKLNPPLSPSYWYTIFFGALLETGLFLETSVWLLASAVFFLFFLSYFIFISFHKKAFSRSKEGRIDGRVLKAHFSTKHLATFLGRTQGALILKEFISIKRDLNQVVQLGVLGVLISVYLLNLKVIAAIPQLQIGGLKNIDPLLQLLNLCMAAFVITAVCTRLVFPSLSIEGRHVWILQAAPLSLHKLIRAKFVGWVIPISVLGVVLFGLGSYVVTPNIIVLMLTSVLGGSIAFAVVGLALFTGAFFANFSWEYQSQLIAGFGNFVFMLCSVVYIFVILSISFLNLLLPASSTFVLIITCLAIVINVIMGFYLLSRAEKSLSMRLQERM